MVQYFKQNLMNEIKVDISSIIRRRMTSNEMSVVAKLLGVNVLQDKGRWGADMPLKYLKDYSTSQIPIGDCNIQVGHTGILFEFEKKLQQALSQSIFDFSSIRRLSIFHQYPQDLVLYLRPHINQKIYAVFLHFQTQRTCHRLGKLILAYTPRYMGSVKYSENFSNTSAIMDYVAYQESNGLDHGDDQRFIKPQRDNFKPMPPYENHQANGQRVVYSYDNREPIQVPPMIQQQNPISYLIPATNYIQPSPQLTLPQVAYPQAMSYNLIPQNVMYGVQNQAFQPFYQPQMFPAQNGMVANQQNLLQFLENDYAKSEIELEEKHEIQDPRQISSKKEINGTNLMVPKLPINQSDSHSQRSRRNSTTSKSRKVSQFARSHSGSRSPESFRKRSTNKNQKKSKKSLINSKSKKSKRLSRYSDHEKNGSSEHSVHSESFYGDHKSRKKKKSKFRFFK